MGNSARLDVVMTECNTMIELVTAMRKELLHVMRFPEAPHVYWLRVDPITKHCEKALDAIIDITRSGLVADRDIEIVNAMSKQISVFVTSLSALFNLTSNAQLNELMKVDRDEGMRFHTLIALNTYHSFAQCLKECAEFYQSVMVTKH